MIDTIRNHLSEPLICRWSRSLPAEGCLPRPTRHDSSNSTCLPCGSRRRIGAICPTSRFRQVRSVGSPCGPRIGSRFPPHRAGAGGPRGSSAWKIGPSGDGANEDAVAVDAPSCRADQISRRRHRQYARGRAVFPRRRTGAKSPAIPLSLRLGAPNAAEMSRRYRLGA